MFGVVINVGSSGSNPNGRGRIFKGALVWKILKNGRIVKYVCTPAVKACSKIAENK